MFGDFKFYEVVWKYLSRDIFYLFLRLYYFEEVVNEEKKNWVKGFFYFVKIYMEYIECEEDDIKLMYVEEGIEVMGVEVRNGCGFYNYCCYV